MPTGVTVFDWLFHDVSAAGCDFHRADAVVRSGFMVTFVLGGMTGVLLAVARRSFVLQYSLFLVAHLPQRR